VAVHRGWDGRADHADHHARPGGRSHMVLNVIVVDDSAMMRLVIGRALRIAGLPIGRIDEAGDGAAALAVLRARPIDLAIIDINMPVMNGLELIRAIIAEQGAAL